MKHVMRGDGTRGHQGAGLGRGGLEFVNELWGDGDEDVNE